MTEKELNFSKKMYSKYLKRIKELEQKKEELESLVTDEKVKRYIELMLVISNSREYTDDEIIRESFKNVKNTSNSLNIYIPIVENNNQDIRYINLETIDVITVDISDIDEFETNNIIIKLNLKSKNFMDSFFKLRTFFFKEVLSSDIETAIQKINTI